MLTWFEIEQKFYNLQDSTLNLYLNKVKSIFSVFPELQDYCVEIYNKKKDLVEYIISKENQDLYVVIQYIDKNKLIDNKKVAIIEKEKINSLNWIYNSLFLKNTNWNSFIYEHIELRAVAIIFCMLGILNNEQWEYERRLDELNWAIKVLEAYYNLDISKLKFENLNYLLLEYNNNLFEEVESTYVYLREEIEQLKQKHFDKLQQKKYIVISEDFYLNECEYIDLDQIKGINYIGIDDIDIYYDNLSNSCFGSIGKTQYIFWLEFIRCIVNNKIKIVTFNKEMFISLFSFVLQQLRDFYIELQEELSKIDINNIMIYSIPDLLIYVGIYKKDIKGIDNWETIQGSLRKLNILDNKISNKLKELPIILEGSESCKRRNIELYYLVRYLKQTFII